MSTNKTFDVIKALHSITDNVRLNGGKLEVELKIPETLDLENGEIVLFTQSHVMKYIRNVTKVMDILLNEVTNSDDIMISSNAIGEGSEDDRGLFLDISVELNKLKSWRDKSEH